MMLVAGSGVSVMAGLNGALASRIGPACAAGNTFRIGFICAPLAVDH